MTDDELLELGAATAMKGVEQALTNAIPEMQKETRKTALTDLKARLEKLERYEPEIRTDVWAGVENDRARMTPDSTGDYLDRSKVLALIDSILSE